MSGGGAFKMIPSSFRNYISKHPNAPFPAVPGRYHIYISYACPWASRCLSYLKVVKPHFGKTKENEDHMGWVFPSSQTKDPGAQPDMLNGARSIRDIYEIAVSNYTGRSSVPVLWDKKLRTIVNNESSEIIWMLNSGFNDFAENPEVDLYPPHLQAATGLLHGYNLTSILGYSNNKCGFARKLEP